MRVLMLVRFGLICFLVGWNECGKMGWPLG